MSAFGPRDIHWYHRWRRYPICLFKLGSNSRQWRYEDDVTAWFGNKIPNSYLSRIQYNQRWHIQIQWPLFFACNFGDWYFYIGAKRDGDMVTWFPALFLGRGWK